MEDPATNANAVAQSTETPKERIDRELSELLEEIRVLLPGAEILFGFLVILPFSGGFSEISGLERILYLMSLLTTSSALALLISPTTYHRLRFREMDKEKMLFTVTRLVIVASVLVLLGIGLAVYLVVESILGGALAGLIAAANAAWFAWFWFGLPLLRKAADARDA